MKQPKNYRRSDKYWIMLWMVGISFGMYCAYASALMLAENYIKPGIVSMTIPSKTWESLSGYICTIPEHNVTCVLPTPTVDMDLG